jgi:hypothetical protein
MKVSHTILALVVLLGLGGVLYYLYKRPAGPDPNEVPKEKIFAFTADQVEEFAIEAPPAEPAVFRRVAAGDSPQWSIVSPEGAQADNSQIQEFLGEVQNMESPALASETAPAWSEYGLETPARTLRFKLTGGKEVALSVGAENPSGEARYGRRSDSNSLWLLNTYENRPLIEKTLLDLRDKRVLPIDISQAQRLAIHLDSGRHRFVMTKQEDGRWVLGDPPVRTDYNAANYFVTTVGGGQMQAVIEEKPTSLERFDLISPELRLDVATPQGTTSLLVGNKIEETENGVETFYAKNTAQPQVFTVNRMVYDQLYQGPESYRNRYLFDFETTNAKWVEIVGPTGELRFEKKNEGWSKVGAAAAGAEQKETTGELKVEEFLNTVHGLRIAAYPSDAPNRFAAYGLDKPWLRVKVVFGEKNQEETIVFSRRNNKFYAGRTGEDSVYELSPNEPDHLEEQLKSLAS